MLNNWRTCFHSSFLRCCTACLRQGGFFRFARCMSFHCSPATWGRAGGCMFCACSVKHDATPTHTTTQPKMHGQTSIYNAHVDMYETATPTATVRYKSVTYTRLNNAVARQQGFKTNTWTKPHNFVFEIFLKR